MKVKIEEIQKLCTDIFNSAGVNNKLSQLVTNNLIDSEIQGYSSHGIIRVKEYITYIKKGYILPKNKPTIHFHSKHISMIQGNKSFGVLVNKKVTNCLLKILKTDKFGFVTFSNSGHIGRLSNIALPVTRAGGITIGFLNFSGSGKNVIPFGSNYPKLCTNPIVMSAPSQDGPILIDFSTSSYSEGKVREAYYKNKKLPNGILVDKNGNSITDPKEFYKKYGEVFLTPLGGNELGYKGFGLALFTEIFAGIVSGGGSSSTHQGNMANSGFFITFLPEIFNQSNQAFNLKVSEFINYLRRQPSGVLDNNISIPGLRKIKNKKIQEIDLPQKTLNELVKLKNVTSC